LARPWPRALAEQGVNVVLNGFGDPAQIEPDRRGLQEAHQRRRSAITGADMTKPSEIADLINCAASEFGRLDILVNNAGPPARRAPVDEFPAEKWDALIAVILSSTFHASTRRDPDHEGAGRVGGSSISPRPTAWWPRPSRLPMWPPSIGVVGLTKGIGGRAGAHGDHLPTPSARAM